MEEETGEFDDKGNPIIRRRKADDEHLIRQALLESRLIDAIISLPLNIFYGAGVPACLLILRKERPSERRDQVLMIYAARHYRELSNQNELRPQDVMRMLVHYHAYGDAAKVPHLVEQHQQRNFAQIEQRTNQEVARLLAEYQEQVDKVAAIDQEISELQAEYALLFDTTAKKKVTSRIDKLTEQRTRPLTKLAERDESWPKSTGAPPVTARQWLKSATNCWRSMLTQTP